MTPSNHRFRGAAPARFASSVALALRTPRRRRRSSAHPSPPRARQTRPSRAAPGTPRAGAPTGSCGSPANRVRVASTNRPALFPFFPGAAPESGSSRRDPRRRRRGSRRRADRSSCGGAPDTGRRDRGFASIRANLDAVRALILHRLRSPRPGDGAVSFLRRAARRSIAVLHPRFRAAGLFGIAVFQRAHVWRNR